MALLRSWPTAFIAWFFAPCLAHALSENSSCEKVELLQTRSLLTHRSPSAQRGADAKYEKCAEYGRCGSYSGTSMSTCEKYYAPPSGEIKDCADGNICTP